MSLLSRQSDTVASGDSLNADREERVATMPDPFEPYQDPAGIDFLPNMLSHLSYEARDIMQAVQALARETKGFRARGRRGAIDNFSKVLDNALSFDGRLTDLIRPLSDLRQTFHFIGSDLDAQLANDLLVGEVRALGFRLREKISAAYKIAVAATDAILAEQPLTTGLIPPQAPAPIKVQIANGRLAISNNKTNFGPVHNDGVERIRAAAAEMLSIALYSINESDNIDKRISIYLEPLRRHLLSPQDKLSVEALGINWRLANSIIDRFKDQLPDIVILQIQESLGPISVILNQYEEWRAFQASEASSTFTAKEAGDLIVGAEDVVRVGLETI